MRSQWISSRIAGVVLAASLSTVLASGCGDDNDGDGDGDGNGNGNGNRSGSAGRSSGTGGSSASSGSGNGATNTGGAAGSTTSGGSSVGGSSVGGAAMACRGLPFEEAGGEGGDGTCAGVASEAEVVPVDLFIMMDRSVSMLEAVSDSDASTRWDAIEQAMQSFVESEELGETGIGIGFFGASGAADETIDCDVDRYAEPRVAIGPVADVGADVVGEITAMRARLGGLTPTVPALQGALQYAKDYAADNAGRATVVVLVTDGYPTQCDNKVSAIADAAREGHETEPFVRTFVVGIAAGFNLDSIARAGGTNAAFEVDESNAVGSLTDALLNISSSQLACEYEMPPPPTGSQLVDPEKVQVVYTPATGEPEEVPRISGLGACGINPNGGWYYDNPAAPTRILVCPCTCERFAAGRVDVRVGCKPRVGLR